MPSLTSILHMLRDGHVEQLALESDHVDVDFLGADDELRHDHRLVLRDDCGLVEEEVQVLGIVRDVHGGTREDVRRTDEAWESDSFAERLRLLRGDGLLPLRLVDLKVLVETLDKLGNFPPLARRALG